MSKGQFDKAFDELTHRRREVLIEFLAGQTDEAIAKSLKITQDTVRQHILAICNKFGLENEFPDERRSKRADLIALFQQYKPELVVAKTPIETTTLEQITLKSIPDKNFVGRERAIAHLNDYDSQGAKVILIHAKGGVGKTTLARNYLQQKFGSCIEFPIAKETENITPVESLLEERLRQLNEEPGREFGVSLERLRQKLQAEKIGVLIDNLEPALDENGKFIKPHRRYVELLRVLADGSLQSLTLITSRDRLHESDVSVWYYFLEGLSVNAWKEYFHSRSLQINSPALNAIHNAYGGNAKAMEIIAGAIQVDYTGNVEQYWQINQGDLLVEADLRDLVNTQFNRLAQHHSPAFKLLCRLGCYRYQDIATVSINGLFSLLWDVPESQHRRVVNSLRDRSLVEFQNGEYWLHPVIREEAISRLRVSEDCEIANRKAAEFWTECVKIVETTQHALTALEPYYHYAAINNFDFACSVLLKGRKNRWIVLGEGEYLGQSMYRLGLLQKLISLINQIKDLVNHGYYLGKLYYILGAVYLLAGKTQESNEYLQKSFQIAVTFKNKELQLDSLITMGFCQIFIGEIEESIRILNDVRIIAEDIDYKGDLVCCWCMLAFLYSSFNHENLKSKALEYAEKAHKKILIVKHRTIIRKGLALVYLGATYKNLNHIEKSLEVYKQTISDAEDTHCIQIKAQAFSSIAELYREQENYEIALYNHSEAIKLLDKLGAKYNLAEAYYQLGLTYQKLGEFYKSRGNFDNATRIFSEMQAPKQVEKVRRARDNGENNQID